MLFPWPMNLVLAQPIFPVLVAMPWPHMERMELRGVDKVRTKAEGKEKPSEEEIISGYAEQRIEYVIPKPISADVVRYAVGLRATTLPSTANMQLELQELMPRTTVVVEEDGEQDFEAFAYVEPGVGKPSDRRVNSSRWHQM